MNFLIQNPNPNFKQYTYPRRGGGFTAPQITLHTYEAPITRSLIAAATWLTQRNTPGSYHALCGARSTRDVLQLAPWSYETWHCVPSNNWSIGISAVMYAHQWKSITSTQRENIVKSMAYAASNAAKWLEKHHGRVVQPRLLTREQAMRKMSGFVYHRTMDPGRRTDPANPQRDFPWDMFITEFNRLMAGGGASKPAKKKEWYEDMDAKTKRELRKIVDEALVNRGLSLQSIREGQSLHAGKIHAAFNREIDSRIVPLLENLSGAVAAVGGGETFDEQKFMDGVRTSINEALAGAEDALREAVIEAVAELPDRAPEEIARAVVDSYVGRLQS